MLIGYVSSVSFPVSVVYQVTGETLKVGGITDENGDGWEEVELPDKNRDNDPEVWILFIFCLGIYIRKERM